MKRQQTLIILFVLIGLFVIACAPIRQDGELEPTAVAEPVETLVVERPSATATTLPTIPPTVTPTPWVTATPLADNSEAIPNAPRIIQHTPDNTGGNDRYPVFTLTFDRAMDQDSVAEALYVWPKVTLGTIWLDETTVDVVVTEALEANVKYDFMVLTTAVDQETVSLTEDYRWSYQLDPILDNITWSESSLPDAPIALTFNYALDPATVDLQLEPTATGEVIWDESYTSLQFVLAQPLRGDTIYRLSLGDALGDSQGEALHSTINETHRTASVISQVFPTQDSSVHPANTIQITFSRPMDEETTKAAFQMEPRMPGALEWHDNVLEFHPLNDRLAAEATFNVTITTDALDVNGNPVFSRDYSWTFQTGEMTARANFGEGTQVQVLSLNGRRAIQFGYPSQPFPTQFNLRRLNSQNWLSTGNMDAGEQIATWQEEPANYVTDYMPIQETMLPADLTAGLYALDIAVGEQVEDQLVVVLTNHVLTVHEDGSQTAVWLTSLDGQIAANAEVQIYAENGSLLHSGLTDDSGLFMLETAVPNTAKIMAQIGDEIAYSGLGGWGSNYMPTPDAYALHLYTNRPIYHPGQPLYYRAIMRQNNNGEPVMLPADTPVHVEMRNYEGTVLQTADLRSSHFGTAFGEFALGDDLEAGDYYLAIEVDEQSMTQQFEIAPARGNHIVTVTADKEMYVQNEDMEIVVEARTRDGQPLANAVVTFEQFETGGAIGCFGAPAFDGDWYDSYRDEMTGRTDENGRFTFTLKADMGYNTHQGRSGNNYHAVWALNAIVSTGEESSTGGFTVVEVSNTAETVSMDFGSRLQQAGQPFTVEGQVLMLDGSPVNGRSLFLGLFDPQAETESVHTAKQGQQVLTGADGRFRTSFTINQPGLYTMRIMGEDAAGHEISAFSDIYADHPSLAGDFGNVTDVILSADRDSYLPGDTAHLLIRSEQDGPALLTFMRGGLHRQQVVQLTSPFTTVAVPITEEDAPNLSVTLQQWGDFYYSFDPEAYYTPNSIPDNYLDSVTLDLRVMDGTAVANVTITPDKDHYAPGEEATFTLRVTNHKGEPISAELSLSLVDEALYSQYSAHTTPLQNALYNQRIHQVQSYDSMRPTRYFPYGSEFGGCGCGGWWGEQATLTSEFSDTAVWLPSLVTDYNGEVIVTITMPDATGEWRLTTRAVTADTQVSEAMITVETE